MNRVLHHEDYPMLFLLLSLLTACTPGATTSRACVVPASPEAPVVTETLAVPDHGDGTAKVTAYTADCAGCIGITRDGTVAESHKRILAADPRYYPLGTKVELTFPDGDVKVYTVRDTGGAIKGPNRFDMLVRTETFANKWGVKHVRFRVMN